ncbi:MAG: 2-oxoacid:acceptor oxidoreductase subunit alpha [Myxococcota bacterium]
MELNIRLSGAAGQGIQTANDILGKLAIRSGYFCYSFNDAESRIRGGINFNHLCVSTLPVSAPRERVDILIALSSPGLESNLENMVDNGVLISGVKTETAEKSTFDLGSLDISNKKVYGTAAVAVVASILKIKLENLEEILQEQFGSKEKIINLNLDAARQAYSRGQDWTKGKALSLNSPEEPINQGNWLSGGDAFALGAAAGGVSFVAAYPMSPATSIMTNLSRWSKELEVHVEQAESEVTAINMVAGASYAGARALASTSGGGFALMTEGISLTGMIETPLVVAIAQRPGPATGLPTRTAQGDLRFAIHGGHGFFPRIVLAPKNINDNFTIVAKAFDLAEKYQIPVIVLTDQLLQDSKQSLENFDLESISQKRYQLSREELEKLDAYRRYRFTDDGISPLAYPGDSFHPVVVDSDEHDQDGHLTESAEISRKMAEKRHRKLKTILQSWEKPESWNLKPGIPLVLTWGSTWGVVNEVQKRLEKQGIEFAHMNLSWMWPLPADVLRKELNQASKSIIVGHSVGSEFESLMREVTLHDFDHAVRKMNGRPFGVEEVEAELKELL